MSDTIDRNASPYYDEPGFYKSPPASSLPIPTFNKRSSTGSGVSTQLSLGEPKSPSDATSHIKQVSSDSKEISTKRKSVSFNSDTKSHDGKRAKSATKDQDKFIDMVRMICLDV